MTASSFSRPPIVAEVWRGPIRESLHYGFYTEVDDAGLLRAGVGDPDFVTTLRSSAKPLQAVPLLTLPNASDVDLTDEELAICCASHPGQPRHAALAASVLALSGYLPDHLVCGPPEHAPSPLKHGCSGNHAAILLAARLMNVPLEGYERPDHPAEAFIYRTIAEMAGAEAMPVATDGCGVLTFGLRLREMARAFAALTRPGAPWERIPRVMGAHPDLIGAENWIDVRLMQVTQGRLIAKTGAEGLLCLGLTGQGRGMAVKILDGSPRPLGLVTLEALERSGWITPEEAAHPLLAELRHPRYTRPNGEVVGEVRRG